MGKVFFYYIENKAPLISSLIVIVIINIILETTVDKSWVIYALPLFHYPFVTATYWYLDFFSSKQFPIRRFI